MRVSRLLTLVGLLKARGSMTAEELAGELGVSRRTVYRDVEVLAKAGVRLESAHGRAGGYRIPRRGRPEMLGLGAEATESAALARALGSDDRRFAALAAPAVSAAARAVREERWVRIVREGDGTGVGTDSALGGGREAESLGRDRDERRDAAAHGPDREAEALGLVHDGERWQLLCREGSELRAEPLDETVTIEPLPRRHSGEPGFDALAAWRSLRSTAPMPRSTFQTPHPVAVDLSDL